MGRPFTYNSGRLYSPARGREAPREAVEQLTTTVHPIIRGRPDAKSFHVPLQFSKIYVW